METLSVVDVGVEPLAVGINVDIRWHCPRQRKLPSLPSKNEQHRGFNSQFQALEVPRPPSPTDLLVQPNLMKKVAKVSHRTQVKLL